MAESTIWVFILVCFYLSIIAIVILVMWNGVLAPLCAFKMMEFFDAFILGLGLRLIHTLID
jgi:hypothetical protein